MSAVLIAKDIFQDDVRLMMDAIEYYKTEGCYTVVGLRSGNILNLDIPLEKLEEIHKKVFGVQE